MHGIYWLACWTVGQPAEQEVRSPRIQVVLHPNQASLALGPLGRSRVVLISFMSKIASWKFINNIIKSSWKFPIIFSTLWGSVRVQFKLAFGASLVFLCQTKMAATSARKKRKINFDFKVFKNMWRRARNFALLNILGGVLCLMSEETKEVNKEHWVT